MSDLVEIGANALRVVEGCSADMSTCGLCTKNTSDCCRNAIRAVYTAIEKAGYRIVPVEPTPEMMQAAADKDPHADVQSEYGYAVAVNTAADLWSAMLAAAPKVS